jgi:hypothetical protein
MARWASDMTRVTTSLTVTITAVGVGGIPSGPGEAANAEAVIIEAVIIEAVIIEAEITAPLGPLIGPHPRRGQARRFRTARAGIDAHRGG